MIYVGIDIAKQKHFADAMTADGEVLIPPFGFTNNAEGFKLFISKIKSFEKTNTQIGLESTAHYAENLIFHLFDLRYHLCVINPIQTSTLRKTNIRKTKTDKVDCLLVIKSMIVNKHRPYSKADIDSLRLKNLCRFREKIKKAKAKLKIQLVTYVDISSLKYSISSNQVYIRIPATIS